MIERTSAPASDADLQHTPVRRRRRPGFTSITAGALILILPAVRCVWNSHADRALQAELQRLRAAGRPVQLADLVPPQVPDDVNALVRLDQAVAAIKLAGDEEQILVTLASSTSVSDADYPSASSLVEGNKEALDLLAEAVALPEASWKCEPNPFLLDVTLPNLAHYRTLARLLSLSAACARREGRFESALDRIRAQLRMADLVDQQPFLISHLVAGGIRSLAFDGLRRCLEDPRFLAEQDTAAVARRRAALAELSAMLLSEHTANRGLVQALHGERLFQLEALTAVIDGRQSWASLSYTGQGVSPSMIERFVNWWLQPLLKTDGVHMQRHMDDLLAACELRSLPQVQQRLQALDLAVDRVKQGMGPIMRPLSAVLMPSLSRAVVAHFQQLDDQRRASVEVAMRAYEMDHGRPPATLQDLVPDYLPELPINLNIDPPRPYTIEDFAPPANP